MKQEKIITSVAEFENLQDFDGIIKLNLRKTEDIEWTPKNAKVELIGGTVNNISGGVVSCIWDGTVNNINGGIVNNINGGMVIGVNDGVINNIGGGTVDNINGGIVNYIWDGKVNNVHGGFIDIINGGMVNIIWSGTVNNISGDSVVNNISNSVINNISGNSVVKITNDLLIESVKENAVVICEGCKPTFRHKDKTASIIYRERLKMDKKRYKNLFHVETEKNGQYWIMYKSVKDDDTDFWSGKIKYENGKVVECPDWHEDYENECGHGLHLSPQPWMTQRYNIGKIKKCRVKVGDIKIHPTPLMPDKVRCKKVEVIGDYEKEEK